MSLPPPSEVVPRIMFDYMLLSEDEIVSACEGMPLKVLRWMAMNHPDNRTRRQLYELTNVPIGEGTVLNVGVTIYDEYRGLVTFGQRVAVASGVTIVAASGPNNSRLADIPYVRDRLTQSEPITIEDDVWIGANAVILPGIVVGKGSIIGAGAVVTENVPPGVVVAGIPARVVRSLG